MKKFRLLSILAVSALLFACNNPDSPSTSSGGANSSTPTSQNTGGTSEVDNKKGTETNPYSVAEAINIASQLASDAYSDEEVCVTGYVVDKPGTKNSSGKFSFHIVDDLSKSETQLYVYLTLSDDDVYQNDQVVVKAYLQNYKGNTNEITGKKLDDGTYTNSNVLSVTTATCSITVGAHEGATVTGIEEGKTAKNGTEVSFSVAADADKKIDKVKANDTTLTAQTDGSYKFTVNGNMVITVETKDATDTSLSGTMQYNKGTTSNMTTGNNAETVGLDETIFNITSTLVGGTTHVGLNKDNHIRLYKNEGSALGIAIVDEKKDEYIIDNIVITLTSDSPAKLNDAKVVVGDKTITGEMKTGEGITENTIGTYLINDTAISISNTNSSQQIFISTIVITYHSVQAA